MLPEVLRGFNSHGSYARFILFVSFVCLILWTTYNVIEVIEDYNHHETIISLDRFPPNSTEMPGVTICAPAIFTPIQLANLYPEFNRSLNEYIDSQQYNLQEEKKDRAYRLELFKKYESLALTRWGAIEVIGKQSLRLEELLNSCHFHVFNLMQFGRASTTQLPPVECFDIRPPLESIYEGRKCFTFFSNVMTAKGDFLDQLRRMKNWTGLNRHDRHDPYPTPRPNTSTTSSHRNVTSKRKKKSKPKSHRKGKGTMSSVGEKLLKMIGLDPDFLERIPSSWQYQTQMIYELNPRIELKVLVNTTVWSYLGDSWSIIFSIHPPNILPTRQNYAFYKVQANAMYDVTFSKQTIQLMESPWKTNCTRSLYPPSPVQTGADFITLVENWKTHGEDNEGHKEPHGPRPQPNEQEAPYKNQDECQFSCVQNEIYKTKKCSNYYFMLTDRILYRFNHTEQKICGHHEQNLSQYLDALNTCQAQCPPECTQILYGNINGVMASYGGACINRYEDQDKTIDECKDSGDECEEFETNETAEATGDDYQQPEASEEEEDKEDKLKDNIDDDYYYEESQPSKVCITVLSIRLAPKKFEYVRHQPAINSEEIWGNVGGHFGIWLGLSLYKIVELAVNLLFRLVYVVLTRVNWL